MHNQQRKAVIGFGLIGQSWTALMIHHGYDVAISDPDEALLANGEQIVEDKLAKVREASGPNRSIG
jgi:carnitine 3-dehydrogenase